MSDLSHRPQAGTTRRGLLTSNIKAIALIAAEALVTKLTPAKARDGNEGGDEGDHGGDRRGDHGGGHGNGKCFLRGTKIQTVEGERRIEALAVGDLLPTVFGGVRPIQWIVRFRRTKVDASEPGQKHARPVRIMKSALAPNIPQADLFLTSGHALSSTGCWSRPVA